MISKTIAAPMVPPAAKMITAKRIICTPFKKTTNPHPYRKKNNN
jgi:hypothetical protein